MIDKENIIDMYYHITTAERYEKIKKFGIVGSNPNNRGALGNMSLDGHLYMLNTNSTEIWNGISNTMIFEDSKFNVFGRHNKPFIALGIPKDSFTSRGLDVTHDSNTEKNEGSLTPYCVTVKLDDIKIPIEEIKHIGTYRTDSDLWESKTRWNIAKANNPDKDIEELTMYLYPLGRVEYKDREKYTTNKVFNTKQKKLKFIKKKIHPIKEIAVDESMWG